jgi:transcriptional regulator with XRE-family HTH domain
MIHQTGEAMTDDVGPVVAARMLGARLRRLRQRHRVTLEEVARVLEISPATISRLENGQGAVRLVNVRALAELYRVADTYEGEALLSLVSTAHSKSWWDDYRADVTPETAVLFGYESGANSWRMYGSFAVPGVLQTPAYVLALARSNLSSLTEAEASRACDLSRARQGVLMHRTTSGALQLNVVLHEACLRQLHGSPGASHDQLTTLRDLSKVENVDLRILPEKACVHVAMTSPWHHFSFAGDFGPVVVVETPAGVQFVEDRHGTRRFDEWFASLTSLSYDQEESADLIDRATNDR